MTMQLTPKEQLVHDLLVYEGLTDGEMAERLGMTERAVKFHVQNLLQKTQAPDRFKMAVAFWRSTSGWDRKNRSVPPVRRRDDAPVPRGRASAKRGAAKKKASGKKKAAARKTSTRKKGTSKRKTAPSRRTTQASRSKKRAARR